MRQRLLAWEGSGRASLASYDAALDHLASHLLRRSSLPAGLGLGPLLFKALGRGRTSIVLDIRSEAYAAGLGGRRGSGSFEGGCAFGGDFGSAVCPNAAEGVFGEDHAHQEPEGILRERG